MFEHNADGHVAGAPGDAFWKSRARAASALLAVLCRRIDLVIYKMGGNNVDTIRP
ncbi:MAG UNVERIFIED_CONTAM: hypothetical protein LVR18_37575 [Planctomycetaceae bacterium]|jgi:hypothetical protein